MAGALFVHASDTGVIATATKAVKIRRLAGEDLEITDHLGLPTKTIVYPETAFVAELTTLVADAAASPTLGTSRDVVDDPALAADPKRVEYVEPTAVPAEVKLWDGSSNVLPVPLELAADILLAIPLLD